MTWRMVHINAYLVVIIRSKPLFFLFLLSKIINITNYKNHEAEPGCCISKQEKGLFSFIPAGERSSKCQIYFHFSLGHLPGASTGGVVWYAPSVSSLIRSVTL